MKNTQLIILTAALGVLTFVAACNMQKSANSNANAGMNSNMSNMPMNHDLGNMSHDQMDHSMMKSSPNAADAPYDLQFLDTMIAHHEGAVVMAKGLDGKAQHAELNTLAKNIIGDQEKEIAQMKKWREEWFAGTSPAINMEMAGMNDSMKGMDMKKLASSTGNDLDLEFIKQMIPHHQGAVIMATEALQKSQKNDIKTLANGIIKAQNAEIKQMQGWQAAWKK